MLQGFPINFSGINTTGLEVNMVIYKRFISNTTDTGITGFLTQVTNSLLYAEDLSMTYLRMNIIKNLSKYATGTCTIFHEQTQTGFLCRTHCLMVLIISAKLFQNLSRNKKVMEQTFATSRHQISRQTAQH